MSKLAAAGERGGARQVSIAILVSFAVLSVVVPGSAADTAQRTFARGGLSGSSASMQPVRVPARVARVAVVPGSNEFWGIGLASAPVPAWDAKSARGQIVFLRNRAGEGWKVVGPPKDAAGRPANPTLTSFALASNGEGWAVGEDGALVHHLAGSGWRMDPDSGLVSETLQAVSLGVSGGEVFGYAVGENSAIVRLSGSTWTVDEGISAVDGDLLAVSAVSPQEAWAVSRASSDALMLWHREGGIWSRELTGRPMFDNPPASAGCCATNKAARGSAVVATPDGVWVTGEIVPVDPSSPFVDELVGDQTRPFALFLANDGALTSYCPDLYALGRYDVDAETTVNATRICDAPMPLSAFDLTSLTVFHGPGGDEVLAGGLGLFRFRDGGWWREPNVAGYLMSVAFSSPNEGWVASSGNTFGAGGAVHSSTTVLGHWTRRPAAPATARWAHPGRKVLEGIAFDPAGRRALAVGQGGISALRGADGVWDTIQLGTDQPLHAVSWPGATAWAVGGRGVIARFDGQRWVFDPASLELVPEALFGVAFRAPDDGVAVGEDGAILRYDGNSWKKDAASKRATKRTLYAVTVVGERYVAVGDAGTVLVSNGAGWRTIAGLDPYLRRGSRAPAALYAIAAIGGNEVAIGGARSVLLVGAPEALRPLATPPEGTIVALDGIRAGGSLRLLASISEETEKFAGDRLALSSAILMQLDGADWRDVQLTAPRTLYSSYEPSRPEDPALGVALEPGGRAGWAVGGRVPNSIDPDGHIQAHPTSSIYRYDTLADPQQPGTRAEPRLPSSGLTFAFFGESGCGLALCSLTVGTGIKGDVIAEQIRQEINTLAKQPGGPAFAVFGGGMRRLGLPEELAQIKGFFSRLAVPTVGALGESDLFQSTETPEISGQAGRLVRGALPSNNIYYREMYGDAPPPWGTGRPNASLKPVSVIGEAQRTPGQARTHYAFDYMQASEQALRVVVLDSSRRSLSSEGQNPPQGQLDYMNRALATRPAGEPALVVMNQPTLNTARGVEIPNWTSAVDVAAFHSALVTNSVSGVFASGIRVNLLYRAGAEGTAGSVPFYVSGAGGAPLEETRYPTDGYYHAWFLANVDPSQRIPPLNQARVTVRAIPVLESIALHAEAGRTQQAGQTLEFTALARAPYGGTSDMTQSQAIYMQLPSPKVCEGPGLARGSCASQEGIHPQYEFWTDDPSIAMFVKPLPGQPLPARNASGNLVPDSQTGFLCAMKPGKTFVNVASGFRMARMPITVTGGEGPCIPQRIDDPPNPVVVLPRVIGPEPAPEPKPPGFRPLSSQNVNVIFPPPPAPVVAPAPPGAPGVGRKEEHEVSTETEGHGGEQGKHASTALVPRPRRDPAASDSWLYLGAVALLSFMSAAGAVAIRQGRPSWEREPRP